MSTRVVVAFTAKDGQADAVAAFLKGTIDQVKNSPGNSGVSMFQDQDDPNRFVAIEDWDKAETHKKLVEGLREAGMIDKALEMMTGMPEMKYYSEL